MALSTVELEIIANAEKALREVKSAAKEIEKQLGGIKTDTFGSKLALNFIAIKEAAQTAFSFVRGAIEETVGAALEAERANVKLAQSMKLVGDFSESALTNVSNFADELSRVTGESDELIKENIALAKAFGLTNNEASELIKVALDLSATTGQDLGSSVTALAQSYNGFLNKTLVKIAPELKRLTAEQLASGDAIAILGNKVDGSAKALGDTFSGSLNKAKNAAGELLETIGNFIIKNETINNTLKVTADGFLKLRDATEESNGSILTLLKNLVTLPASLGAFLGTKVRNSILGIKEQITGVVEENEQLLKSIKDARNASRNEVAQEAIIKSKRLAELAEKDLAEKRQKIESQIANIKEQIQGRAVDKVGKLQLDSAKRVEIVEKAAKLGVISLAEKQLLIEQERLALVKEIAEIQKQKISEISNNPFEAIIKNGSKVFQGDSGKALAAGFTNMILKGQEGARKAISSAFAAIAEAIIPGIGPVVGEIIDVLSKGPEETRKMVEGFVRAIPDLIKNLAESLPVLIQTLVTELPPALAKAMPQVALSFSVELIRNIPNIIKGFVEGLINAAGEFVNALIDAIPGVGGAFNTISGKGSGGIFEGIPILGGIGDIFGFAEGGRVPLNPQFEGDKFPAKLNSGEQVFSKDLTQDLENFLNQNKNSQTDQTLVVNLIVGEQQLASTILNLNRNGFRLA